MGGHTNAKSDKLATENKQNLIDNAKSKRLERDGSGSKKKVTEIMKLQQDLFVMTYHTVFRRLDEERVWNVDEESKEMFSPQIMYPIALEQDIPWRHWQEWLRGQ